MIVRNAAARDRLHAISAGNGPASIPSATNFVTIDCGRDGPYAVRVLKALAARGVFIRKPSAPILDRCIRISTGPEEQMDIVAEELRQALRDAAAA